MMPNEGRRRGAVIRGAIVAVAAIALVALALQPWNAQTSGSATSAPSSASSAAAIPSGSPAPAASPTGAPPSVSSAPAPSPSAPASPAPASAAPSVSPDPQAVLAARLQLTLDRTRARFSIPGASVAILWDDGRSWVGASGMRDVAAGDPMTTDTGFAFASISKTLTAAVVLQLVEEGRLGLDDSAARRLPAFGLDPRITVRMLLDHTSGLPDYFLGKGIDAALRKAPNATWTALQAWAYVPAKHAVPGASWSYSNTNYLLLGELVTAVTGKPLATEVRTRLLDPIGLTTAWYQSAERPEATGTLAYILTAQAGGGWKPTPVARASSVMPFRSVVTAAGGAGSVAGTARDAALWIRAWAGGSVLSPAMQQEVLADVDRTVALKARIPYGLGIQRVTLNGYTALGHSGRYLGFRNVARYLPDAGVTIAVLTNQSVWDPNRIATALLKVVLPTPTPTPGASASPGASNSPAASPSPSSP